jgi:hypothetical protein
VQPTGVAWARVDAVGSNETVYMKVDESVELWRAGSEGSIKSVVLLFVNPLSTSQQSVQRDATCLRAAYRAEAARSVRLHLSVFQMP